MLYTQSTAKGHIRAKQNIFLPQVHILIHYLINTHSTVDDWKQLWKIKLNEPERQKLEPRVNLLYQSSNTPTQLLRQRLGETRIACSLLLQRASGHPPYRQLWLVEPSMFSLAGLHPTRSVGTPSACLLWRARVPPRHRLYVKSILPPGDVSSAFKSNHQHFFSLPRMIQIWW